MNAGLDARQLLDEIEGEGGRVHVRRGGVQVVPSSLLTPTRKARLVVAGAPLLDLLRERQLGVAKEQRPRLAPIGSVACELRRFTNWNSDVLVRFCAEPGHWHEPCTSGEIAFDCVELDVLVTWKKANGIQKLNLDLRNAILDLKLAFGGRVSAETLERLTETTPSQRPSSPNPEMQASCGLRNPGDT